MKRSGAEVKKLTKTKKTAFIIAAAAAMLIIIKNIRK